ncbi:hypothetical protein E2R51_17060 [Jeotgalibacillus sp. S-D1]|uniref:DnaA ATPase domain-containing protein n=1 Tax=Jeotgalibacillus sp. S-D1 TaxID=2552189 RepID=UPI001059BD2A|nr:DnaA/Hda family protein [Jeotgalibacillus sp. S-D1]TDL30696.1 hypothetical protein E2R51_17060 [Jeotgalibacillus sp. S-D1]
MELNSTKMRTAVNELSNVLRSEDIKEDYLELYAGSNVLTTVNNIKNQVIYGRRGTGKTHLLNALKELLYQEMYDKRIYPVYIDLRNTSTFEETFANNPKLNALVYFQNILKMLVEHIVEEFEFIVNPLSHLENFQVNQIRYELSSHLKELNIVLNGNKFMKQGEFSIDSESVKALVGDFSTTGARIKPEFKNTKKAQENGIKFISFGELTKILNNIVRILSLNNIILMLDEWSEIDISTQPYLSHLLKIAFVSSSIKLKIGAIKFRTRLMIDDNDSRFGLEDGGDIFGNDLDNKYVYELNEDATKDYFNELLFKHLSKHYPELHGIYFSEKNAKPRINFIGEFFTHQALGEILIGSAGVSRDFLNIFISAYEEFISNHSDKKVSVHNIRKATQQWYSVDKQNRIDNEPNAKKLLDHIIDYVLREKKVTHCLISQKYFSNKYLQTLVDLRVIHLRKRGYSHQDIKGEVYDVYSIDYGCFTNNNYTTNQLDTKTADDIEVIDNYREIRRIALSDEIFSKHRLEVGEGLICDKCNNVIDTSHPAFLKQSLCTNCWERYESSIPIQEAATRK